MMQIDSLDTNLLQTAKRPKADAPLSDEDQSPAALQKKRIIKWVAYSAIFLWALVFFTIVKIPDAAVTNFALNSLNQNTPYQWQAENMRLSLFPWIHLSGEKVNLDPKYPGAGIPLALDEFRIYPNPFSFLPFGGGPAFGGSYSIDAYKSSFHGSLAAGKNISFRLESESLDLARLTPLSQNGVDLKGTLTSLFVQLALPQQRLAQADGEIKVQGKNMVFDASSLGLGMPLPILNLGDIDVQASANKGVVKIQKCRIGSAGKDLELQITNASTFTLSDVTPNTRYDLHVVIKPSAGILSAVPALGGMLDSMATKRPDGAYSLKLQGTFAAPGFPTKE